MKLLYRFLEHSEATKNNNFNKHCLQFNIFAAIVSESLVNFSIKV